ncbi:hypothetical protein HDK77DRAFT_317901 [Phyllosticta capitalensis]
MTTSHTLALGLLASRLFFISIFFWSLLNFGLSLTHSLLSFFSSTTRLRDHYYTITQTADTLIQIHQTYLLQTPLAIDTIHLVKH